MGETKEIATNKVKQVLRALPADDEKKRNVYSNKIQQRVLILSFEKLNIRVKFAAY